jgi:hypothetical protein
MLVSLRGSRRVCKNAGVPPVDISASLVQSGSRVAKVLHLACQFKRNHKRISTEDVEFARRVLKINPTTARCLCDTTVTRSLENVNSQKYEAKNEMRLLVEGAVIDDLRGQSIPFSVVNLCNVIEQLLIFTARRTVTGEIVRETASAVWDMHSFSNHNRQLEKEFRGLLSKWRVSKSAVLLAAGLFSCTPQTNVSGFVGEHGVPDGTE